MTIAAARMKEVLNAKSLKDFGKFMDGQTGEIVNGKMHYFDDDILRWLKRKPVID